MWLRILRRLLSSNGERRVSRKRWKITEVCPLKLGFESLEDRVVPSTFVTLHNFTGPSTDGATPDSGLILNSSGDLFGTTKSGGSGDGTVFELTPGIGGYSTKILHAFTGGADGQTPLASLVLDGNGNLFGTTSAGGDAKGDGTVFELTPSNGGYNFKTIYTFTGGADGQNPSTPLVVDQNGDLFGTTGHGSTSSGTVFELTPGSNGYTLNTLYTFTGGNDGDNPGAVVLHNGDLFGTTSKGGKNNDGTVFELTPGSNGYTLSTLYTFTGGNDGADPASGLIIDGSGNLFDSTYAGGSDQLGTVFEMTSGSSGYTFNTIYTFAGGADGMAPNAGLVLDGTGDLFGTTSGGNTANQTDGTVFELTPGINGYNFITLHTFVGSDGAKPNSLVLDGNANIFGTAEEGGTSGDGTVFGLLNDPIVASISPNVGLPSGGTKVIINGSNLTTVSEVDFGPLPGTIVSETPTQIVVLSPAEAPGTLDVSAKGPSGISTTSAGDSFTVEQAAPTFNDLSSPTITYGSKSATISGTLDANAGGQNVPAGEMVQVTFDGVTQDAPLDINDNFSTTFNTAGVAASDTPYPIDISYNGDVDFVGTNASDTLTVDAAQPSFGSVSSPTITYGKASTIISGTLEPDAGSQLIPAGETVQITLNGVTQNAALGLNDSFSSSFYTGTLGANGSPYTIDFSYNGDADFAGASDTSMLKVNPSTPEFISLSGPTIIQGSPSTTISGSLLSLTGSQLVPGGETVQVTLGGVTQNATLASNDTFSTTFDTSALVVSSTPYPIDFSYGGDGNFNGATGKSSLSVKLGPADPANSFVMLPVSTIQFGGVTTITLQARDVNGNNLTTGGLNVLFVLGNKTGAKGVFGKVIDNKNGTYTGSFAGTLDGNNTITAIVNGTAVSSTAPITVSGGPVSLAESTVTVTNSQITAGTTTTVTLQAEYFTNRDEPAGGLTVAFRLGSPIGGHGTFTGVTYIGNGQYTATFTGTLAGSNSIHAYIDGYAVTSLAPTIKVIAAPLSLSYSPATVSAAAMQAGRTIIVTWQPEDAWGNKLNLGSTPLPVFSLESGTGTFGQVTYNKNGTYSATFTTTAAGSYSIQTMYNNQAVTDKAPTVTVVPLAASIAKSIVSVTPSNEVVSGSSITVTLQAEDAYGNHETTGGLVVGFKLVGGSGQGTFSRVAYIGNGMYQATFTGTLAGNNTIEATMNGVKATSTQSITVTPGPVSLARSIARVASPGSVAVGNTITVYLQTKDAAGNNLTTDLLTEGTSISFELGSSIGGTEGVFATATYLGNGEYEASFTADKAGSNTVVALINNSKLTSIAPAIKVVAAA